MPGTGLGDSGKDCLGSSKVTGTANFPSNFVEHWKLVLLFIKDFISIYRPPHFGYQICITSRIWMTANYIQGNERYIAAYIWALEGWACLSLFPIGWSSYRRLLLVGNSPRVRCRLRDFRGQTLTIWTGDSQLIHSQLVVSECKILNFHLSRSSYSHLPA